MVGSDAATWAAAAALVAVIPGIWEFSRSLRVIGQRPARFPWGRLVKACPTTVRRLLPDLASGVVAFIVVSPGAGYRVEVAQSFGFSGEAVTAVMAGAVGPLMLRANILWGQTFLNSREQADGKVANLYFLWDTEKRDRKLPGLMEVPKEQLRGRVQMFLRDNLSGERLDEQLTFLDRCLKNAATPDPDVRKEAYEGIYGLITKVRGHEILLSDLLRSDHAQQLNRLLTAAGIGTVTAFGTFMAEGAGMSGQTPPLEVVITVLGATALGVAAGFAAWAGWPIARTFLASGSAGVASAKAAASNLEEVQSPPPASKVAEPEGQPTDHHNLTDPEPDRSR